MKSYHIDNSLVCSNNPEITDDSRARQNIICYTAKIRLASTSSDATVGSRSESGAAEGLFTGDEYFKSDVRKVVKIIALKVILTN